MVTKRNLNERLRKIDLQESFPHQDIENLFEAISLGESDQFKEDLHEYELLIAGSRSYFTSKSLFRPRLPAYQKEQLRYSFFEMYPSYQIIVPHLEQAPCLKKELAVFESARVLILELIKKSNREEWVE